MRQHDLNWDLWLIGQAQALMVCDPWDNLLWALGFVGQDDALLVYNPGDSLLWVLGYGDVGVILLGIMELLVGWRGWGWHSRGSRGGGPGGEGGEGGVGRGVGAHTCIDIIYITER